MSNSIWKTKAIVPEENGKQILVKFQNNWWHTEKITRRMMREWPDYYETGYLEWCYIDELLTQADKAERLQKAVDLIANMEQRLCIDDPVDILDDVLKIAKDEIKQMIKGE